MAMFLHLIFGALPATISVSTMTYQQLTSKIVGEFDGKILSQFQRLSMKGSELDCQYQCLRDRECLSFFYDQTTGACQTHGVVFFNSNDGELSPGSRYYRQFEDACPSQLGYIYNRVLDFCYKFHFQSAANFSYARQVCQENGGDLVITNTKEKLYHIAQTIKGTTFPVSPIFLVGATDETTEGDWRWLDGQQVDPEFWNPGTPNGAYDSEDYATIDVWGELTSSLNDRGPSKDLPFICELMI